MFGWGHGGYLGGPFGVSESIGGFPVSSLIPGHRGVGAGGFVVRIDVRHRDVLLVGGVDDWHVHVVVAGDVLVSQP